MGAGLLVLGSTLFMHAGTNLSSLNTDRLPHFWNAMDDPGKPVTVLSFGDSMAEPGRSIQLELFGRLRDEYGIGGRSLLTAWGEAIWGFGNGAFKSQPTADWWTVHVVVPPGGYVDYSNLQAPPDHAVLCDSVGIFWVARPQGGLFTLSVSTNGGPWSAPLLTLQGYSAQSTGCYTNIPVDRGNYRLRVDGLSGTNLIVGPQYLDTATGGVDVAFMAKGGANLNQIFNLSTNVLYPIVTALDPQLVMIHMKEIGGIGATSLSNRIHDLEQLWQRCAPNGDIIYIGTPWQVSDLSTNWTESQNQIIRNAALRDGRCYVDCMTPMVSYPWMTNNSYLDDGVHVSKAGNQFLADLLWQELGFYALRLDRTLTLHSSPAGMVLDWATREDITFNLQSTTNLTTWETLHSVSGDNSRHAWTNSPSTQAGFYRIQMSPE